MKLTSSGLPTDYRRARAQFLAAARDAGARVHEHVHPLPGADGGPIAISTAHLHPGAADQIVVVSGTHGVEGFAGSAAQTALLQAPDLDLPPEVGVFLVHAFNPFGFSHLRRVNEDNVDLNRNFIDFGAATPENPGYDELAGLLVPDRWDAETQERTTAALLAWIGEHGAAAAQQAISGGQYAHPHGLFYGGSGPVWSRRVAEELYPETLAGTRRVAVIDLHTGLGPRGYGDLLSSRPSTHPEFARAASWYGADQVHSVADGTSVSADVAGDWLAVVDSWLPDAEVTGIAIEWGTVDQIEVVQALRADHWLHAHGGPGHPDAPAIKARLREAFAPDDPDWARAVHDRFADVFTRTLTALSHSP